jgi:hypothetical protein
MKKVNLFLVGLVALATMSVGLSSCSNNNSWLIGTWEISIPHYGTQKLIIHDSKHYSSISESFNLEVKGIYTVNGTGTEITLYPKESNAPESLKDQDPQPYSKKIDKANQTIEFSAKTGDYYRKVSSN